MHFRVASRNFHVFNASRWFHHMVVGGLIMVIFLMLFFMMCVIGIVKQQRNKDGEGECTNNNRKQHDGLREGVLGMVLCSLP